MKHLAALGPIDWLDLFRATLELAIARHFLGTRTEKDLLQTAGNGSATVSNPLSDEQLRWVNRVAFALPRVAVRLPWRADCLVQAIAAQRWLKRKGITTTLHLGVDKRSPAEFEAHAWLMQGDMVVTGGGDIGRYTRLHRNERHA